LDDFITYQKIKKIIRDFKPDIVHTHASKAGALGRLAASHMRVPVIVHTFHGHVFHSYFNSARTGFFLRVERYLAGKSSAIIAISEKQKEELSTIYSVCKPEKIRVIPLGFDLSKFQEQQEEKRKSFRSQYLLEEDEIAVGIIGRLVPVKNHLMFLRALQLLAAQTSRKVRAFIIGDGEERSNLEAAASTLHIPFVDFNSSPAPSLLTFTSWIKNIDWAVAGLDVVAMTSFNEGTPVSLVEAQAAAKPIVATRVGGIENVVVEGLTALLSESDNAEKFAANLLLLTENDALRKELGKHSWENVKQKFDYRRLIRDMSMLYNDLLQKHDSF